MAKDEIKESQSLQLQLAVPAAQEGYTDIFIRNFCVLISSEWMQNEILDDSPEGWNRLCVNERVDATIDSKQNSKYRREIFCSI